MTVVLFSTFVVKETIFSKIINYLHEKLAIIILFINNFIFIIIL